MIRGFNNLKITTKFFLIILVIGPFTLLLAGVGIWGVSQVNDYVQGFNSDQLTSNTSLLRTALKIQTTRLALSQTLRETEPARLQEELNLVRQSIEEARASWESYRGTPLSEEEKKYAAHFESEWQTWRTAIQNSDNQSGEANTNRGQILSAGHDQTLLAILDQLVTINKTDAQEEADVAESTFVTVVIVIVISAVLIFLLTIGVLALLARLINQPIQKLKTLTEIVATGDLSAPADLTERQDELGQLTISFNITVGALRELVRQLLGQIQQINGAASELRSQATSQLSGSSQQTEAIVMAVSSLQELKKATDAIAQQARGVNRTVHHSLKQAHTVNELIRQMVLSHEAGRQSLSQSLTAIQVLREHLLASQEQQEVLADQSQMIDGVISLIDDLAQQTHLLSLNAAIEAAGAGEAGRRFGVVVGEIKQLADRAGRATGRIRTALGNIDLSIQTNRQRGQESLTYLEQAVSQANKSDRVIEGLNSLSQQVSAATDQIVEAVSDSATLSNHIEQVTLEQQTASSQLLQTMTELEAITIQSLSAVRQSETATYELNLAAQELEDSANRFHLQGAGSR